MKMSLHMRSCENLMTIYIEMSHRKLHYNTHRYQAFNNQSDLMSVWNVYSSMLSMSNLTFAAQFANEFFLAPFIEFKLLIFFCFV